MEPAKPYFAILPKTEKIPLLPLAAVIAIIIITAAAYFAFFAQPQAAFRALVFAGNDPLPNATVEAFAANKSLGKAVTDANGVAIFTSLPRQIITFKVTKQGYPSTTFTVDTSKTFTRRTDLLAATSQTGGFSIRFTIKNEEGRPVSGARVASSIDGKTETTFTDETGSTVVIAQRGAFIRVRASAPGFQSESLAFIAQKNTETVTLKRSEQKIEKGSIVAKVIDRTTQSGIAQATVFLYDDSTNVLIANASTSDGKAVFSDVSLGSSVYFMVEATGYVFPSSAQEQRITVSTTTSVNIALDPIGSIPSAPTTIKTVDETGKAIAATVYLGVQQSSRTLPPIESSGSVTREMSTNATYYAVAIASGRVYARTQQFRAGETQTLTLPTATSANSVTLTINPVDEDGFAATGFSIGLFENGLFALPSQENGFYDASVVFENVPKGANLEVHAADKDNPLISATENAVADVDKNITLNIRTKIAFIEISSIDFETGTSLPATFTSFYNDEKYESCSGSSCTIAVRAFDDVKITGKASGYADWLYESGSLSAGATKNVSAKFVPAAAANGTYAEFLGLTNIAGDTVTLVRPNTDYFAHFQYVSSQADEAGLAVRVGTQTDVATDIASITDYPSGEGVARSTSFTPGSSCAIDLSHNQASDDQYKYVDISLGGGYAGEVVVKIHVKETATSASKVRLFFRAYARRGALWYRDPFDNTLKFSPNATGKDGCYANAHQEEFSVINPVTQQPIESDFSEEAGISFDRFTGKLKMEPAITQLKLQIDTVMPGDALPLVSKSPECSLLYSVQASPRTQGCYRVQNNKLIFESGDSNPSCPIKVDRNFIEADKGANLTIQGACAGFSSALTLPIVINNVSVESAFVRPQGNELGEGDAAKILFIVNNKQAGRTVRTTVDQPGIADKTFTFNGPGVQAVAWRGPGTLSFLEGNKTLPGGSIYYEQAAPYLFGNVSATGMRVNSCTDFHCCASGWCTRSAFQDNIQNFRDTAEMVGNQTAFRRGNGQPFKTLFPNNHFKFYTVAQLIEGSQQILSDNGVTVAPTALSAGTCLTNNPGVYDLRAESDGTSNYSYIASVIPLQTFAYVTPCNDPVPGNQIPLCNYIFGNSSCINTRSNSNLLTLSQNKELHYDYRVCMYPTTPVLSAPFCAVGLTPASVGFKWWQAHANAQKACEEQADAECPGYCSGSAAKCGTAGAVGGPYGAAIGAVACGAGCAATCKEAYVAACIGPETKAEYSKLPTAAGYSLFPKITILRKTGDLEYANASEANAFRKIGKVLSEFDFHDAQSIDDFVANPALDFKGGNCADVKINFKDTIIGIATNVGTQEAVQYLRSRGKAELLKDAGTRLASQLDGLIPAIYGVCRGDNGDVYRDFQVWPPNNAVPIGTGETLALFGESAQETPLQRADDTRSCLYTWPTPLTPETYTCGGKTRPALPLHQCGGIISKLATGGQSVGRPGSIVVGARGDTVYVRMDIGVEGDCDVSNPFVGFDAWDSAANNFLPLLAYFTGSKSNLELTLTDGLDIFQVDSSSATTTETHGDGSVTYRDSAGNAWTVQASGDWVYTKAPSSCTTTYTVSDKRLRSTCAPDGWVWKEDKTGGFYSTRDSFAEIKYKNVDGSIVTSWHPRDPQPNRFYTGGGLTNEPVGEDGKLVNVATHDLVMPPLTEQAKTQGAAGSSGADTGRTGSSTATIEPSIFLDNKGNIISTRPAPTGSLSEPNGPQYPELIPTAYAGGSTTGSNSHCYGISDQSSCDSDLECRWEEPPTPGFCTPR